LATANKTSKTNRTAPRIRRAIPALLRCCGGGGEDSCLRI
jgi:hypothetical protein